jgi:queuine tRNA-ribosyltransferase
MVGSFQVTKRDGNARLGRFETALHGGFDTPNFMPVGTRGSVKGVDMGHLLQVGAQIMLVNTYHLWLRPTPATVQKLGGIHTFVGWNGPMLSDSGGFQVFSLKGIRKLSEEGVEFRSHIDGAKMFLSPEGSIQIQETLGVDIAMAFDECPAGDLPHDQVARSLELTHRWAKRSLAARQTDRTALFGITQGGIFPDLRARAAEQIGALPFDGVAIGGLSVGERKEHMYEVLSYHPKQLPDGKIHYLMGVGTPEDIVEAVYNGVDLFDCVMPTRSGRTGRAYIDGPLPFINIKNAFHAESTEPLDSTCDCFTCTRHSRGYLNHLFRVQEMLGPQLLSIHNLRYYLRLMERIRTAIGEGTFHELHRAERARWKDFSDLVESTP